MENNQSQVSEQPVVDHTPKRSRRTSIVLIGSVLLIVIVGFSGKYLIKGNSQTSPSPTISQEAYVSPSISKSPCGTQITISKEGSITYLTDRINNYKMNVSTLPEFAFTTGSWCSGERYEIEMYAERTNPAGSVARLAVLEPEILTNNSSLTDFAKTDFNYVEGEHVDPNGNNYGRPFISSPLVTRTLPNGVKEIEWEEKYSDNPTYREGTTAVKYYLLQVGNKVYAFYVMSWDIPAFRKAVTDFDTVISTFQSPVN